MTQYFLDSSALIKRYVVKPGTTWVRSLTNHSSGNTTIIAQITQIEIVSGASRRVREGTLTTRTARAVRLLIDRHVRREYVVIGLTPQVVRRAEDLLAVHPLRTYDAVQLASALESQGLGCQCANGGEGGGDYQTHLGMDQWLNTGNASSSVGVAISLLHRLHQGSSCPKRIVGGWEIVNFVRLEGSDIFSRIQFFGQDTDESQLFQRRQLSNRWQ